MSALAGTYSTKSSKAAAEDIYRNVYIKGNADIEIISSGHHRTPIQINDDGTVALTIRNHDIYVDTTVSHYPQPHITIYTNDLRHFAFYGNGQVSSDNLRTQKLSVDINGNTHVRWKGKDINLRELTVNGDNQITINDIKSHGLKAEIHNESRITLNGIVNINELTLTDNSYCKIEWVDSPSLQVFMSESAEIELAGIADTLDLEMKGDSYANTKYLRSADAYINTHNFARADVRVLDTLSTQTHDRSNVYYFKEPELTIPYMTGNGSVLSYAH
ncbi:MAG: hypothetical protein Tsb005_18020 [Gammaproteobacteria bacterium]